MNKIYKHQKEGRIAQKIGKYRVVKLGNGTEKWYQQESTLIDLGFKLHGYEPEKIHKIFFDEYKLIPDEKHETASH